MKKRPHYGIEAPYVPACMLAGALAFLLLSLLQPWFLVGAAALIAQAFIRDYYRLLKKLGAVQLIKRELGIRYWYGGPWAATSAVLATKI